MERDEKPIDIDDPASFAHADNSGRRSGMDDAAVPPQERPDQPVSADVQSSTDAHTPGSTVAPAPGTKIDEAAFMVRAGGDPQLACELIDLLFQQLPLLRADVDKALSARDGRALGRAAHSLKGSVGNFGARTAMELAKKLELSIPASGDFEQAASLRSQLEKELTLLEVELKALRGRLASSS